MSRGARIRRVIGRSLVALGCTLVLAAGLGYLWLRTSLPELDGVINVGGLDQPVEIVRDPRGVPHIFAATMADAVFALGFAHAQDRLFQMDLQRRTGAGRLAELLGERAVPFDRWLRTLGLGRAAEQSWAVQDDDTRAIYQAYADGVNAALAGHRGAWPLEYVLLRSTPEPWRPVDSILVLQAMSLLLGTNMADETRRLALAARLAPERIAELWPGEPAPPLDSFPLIPSLTGAGSGAEPGGSNGWIVAGSRSATGKPLLANDPHLGLGLPGIWYLAHIEASDRRLIGATIPGMPSLVIGHNGHVAWGFTNTYADTQDLFVERLDDAALSARQEVIRVRGAADVVLTIRETAHGPVLSDADPELAALVGPGHVVSLAWTALRPGDTTPSVGPRLAEVATVAEFIAATRPYLGPMQNMMVADTQGAIAVVAPGLVPIRRARDGRVPAPGWTDDGDWIGFIPFDALPRIVDPPSGVIVTANARWIPDDYGPLITRDWAPPFRADRIRELLEATPRHTLESFRAIQSDQVSPVAGALLPYLRAIAPVTALGQAAHALLASWDGTMALELPQPLIFAAWYRALQPAILADKIGPDLASESWVSPTFFIDAFAAGSAAAWCDDTATVAREDCTAIATRAFDATVAELAARYGDDPSMWRWSTVHRARHGHPILARLPVIGDLFAVMQPIGGDRFTINVSGTDGPPDDPFRSGFGPGFRAIYDLADLDRSLFVIAVGQSGNPLSPHARDLAERWRVNDPFTIPAVKPEGRGVRTQILRPAPCEGATPC